MRRLPKPKPCPFCGTKDEVLVMRHHETGLYFVWCGECGARGSQHKTERAAIINWNACNKRKEESK